MIAFRAYLLKRIDILLCAGRTKRKQVGDAPRQCGGRSNVEHRDKIMGAKQKGSERT